MTFNSRSYYLLTAKAGRGKSALLSRWVAQLITEKQWTVVFLPISIRFGSSSPTQYFPILANRLEQAFDAPITQDPKATVEVWKNICVQFLGSERRSKNKILIVIDGLDESSNKDWRIWQSLLPKDGSRMPVLISARHVEKDHDPSGWQERLNLNQKCVTQELQLLSEEAIPEILASMEDPLRHFKNRKAIRKELFRLTQGDPLLLRLYVDSLHDSLNKEAYSVLTEEALLNKLKSAKPELIGFFSLWWADQRLSWKEQGKDAAKLQIALLDILQVLSAAKGPLTGVDLERLLAEDEAKLPQITAVVQEAPRIIVGQPSTGFSLAHPRLKEYFLSGDQITLDGKRSLQKRFLKYGSRVLKGLEADNLKFTEVSPYLIYHLREHLKGGLEAGLVSVEDIYALRNENWMRAHEYVLGSPSSFLEDVFLVLETAASQGKKGIPMMIWCGLCFSSVTSLASNIFPELIRAFLTIDIGGGKTFFSLDQALAYVDLIADTEGKVKGLFEILSTPLPPVRQREIYQKIYELVEQFIDAGRDLYRAVDWLLDISDHYSGMEQTLVQHALEVAREIDDSKGRSRALVKIACCLPPDQALEVAREIDDPEGCAQALAEITDRLPPEKVAQVLTEALEVAREIDSRYGRSRALAEIAGRLPLEKALEVAREIDFRYSRSSALAKIAGHFPPDKAPQILKEALDVAREIYYRYNRLSALAKIAGHFPPDKAPQILKEALDVAREMYHSAYCSNALAEIVDRLPPENAPQILKEALEVARKFDDSKDRSRSLAEIAGRLPLEKALEVAREIDDPDYRSRSLAEIAGRLPPEKAAQVLAEALEVAREIDNLLYRFRALAEIASRLPPEKAAQVLAEALEVAREIDNPLYRSRALAEIASRLPPEKAAQVLAEALEVAREIDVRWYRVHALAEIASRLPPEKAAQVLAEALEVAREIDHPLYRSRALAEIASRLPPELALEVAREIDVRWYRVHALAEIAGRLPPELALEVAREIDNPLYRSRALAEIAGRVPSEQAAQILKEALEVDREIDDPKDRSLALAEIAKRLVPEHALEVAREIGDSYYRFQALAEIANRMSSKKAAEIIKEALEVVCEIATCDSRSRALAEIAKHLLPQQAAHVIVEDLLKTTTNLSTSPLYRKDYISYVQNYIKFFSTILDDDDFMSIANLINEVCEWWP